MSKKRLAWSEPRPLSGKQGTRAWYYVNRGSVDLVIEAGECRVVTKRIRRSVLLAMLAEIKDR